MATAEAAVRARRAAKVKVRETPPGGTRRWLAIAFLAPALIFLGAIVIYPTIDTVIQSFQTPLERTFVGFDNYKEIADTDRIRTAIRNNAIWVATAPAIITGLGLMFAILTERVRYSTAIKVIVFMPMAISFLSTGVIWRLMYEEDPHRGLVNGAIGAVYDVFKGAGPYPDARALPDAPYEEGKGRALTTTDEFSAGDVATIGLVAIADADLPKDAVQAAEPDIPEGGFGMVVWRDFKPGGGEPGVIEEGEVGLPGTSVALLGPDGSKVADGEAGPDGSVVFEDVGEGPFKAQVTAATFSRGFTGITWLGSALVTPAIIGAFCWMWAGFAVVVIGAGLAALPRDVLEAARVDGANEWQTFRFVTLPLLAPVLGVVFVTLVINVLKIFDIVLVTAPGAVQDESNVIALEMYKTSFTSRQYGVGSAVAVLLFVLVVPVMILNLRRFRREG